jgi:hypothetical protein
MEEHASEIGTLNEGPLHAALKDWYARPGDQFEVSVGDFVIDIVRGDLLIEIQTGSFTSIRRKLKALVAEHPVRLIYPVAREKWIVRLAEDGESVLGRRRSPKRGSLEHVFGELVSFPRLLAKPNLSIEVLLIQEDELRHRDEKRGWRRHGWVVHERRLLDVVERRLFESPQDLAALLPSGLVEPWTTADLAKAAGLPRRLAQQMAYCLRKTGVIESVERRGRAHLYVRA